MTEAGRLFDPGPEAATVTPEATRPDGRCVAVVVDVPAVKRVFDYVVPPKMADRVRIGSMVRVPLGGRRVRGWVVALDVRPPEGVRLVEVAKLSGEGPPEDIIELCGWAAWRWAGRVPTLLGTASPPSMVRHLPSPFPRRTPVATVDDAVAGVAADLVAAPRTVLRAAPGLDLAPYIAALPIADDLLVVCPTQRIADEVTQGLRRLGVRSAAHPGGWSQGAAGATVVGTRSAVFAPMARLGAIVVVDEHDEAHQNEGSPTWHSREVAFERGRRRRVPVILTSPIPTAEARRHSTVVLTDRTTERHGWSGIDIIDRRDEDRGRTGPFSPRLVAALSEAESAVVVLNRKGRSALLACRSCRSVAACARCGAAVRLDDVDELRCARCDARRPLVCLSCGGSAFAQRRWGVSHLRDDLEALLRRPVAEVTSSGRKGPSAATVVVGTEAALRRTSRVDAVAFVEFDQELLAPRYRAGEEAFALLAMASRAVHGRAAGGRVHVQTTEPGHEVLDAAVNADPSRFSEIDDERRSILGLPPFGTVVAIGGAAGEEFVARLELPPGVTAARVGDDWIVRGSDRTALLDALAEVDRPPGRLRLWVDPLRLPA